jgi:putative membrane protein
MIETGGFLAQHMAVHILAMNVAAPAAVLAWRRFSAGPPDAGGIRWIGWAAALQIALLWLWHLPDAMAFAFGTRGGQVLMYLTLFAAALWFWHGIVNNAHAACWRALGALLFTGKLFCLLGILFTFAPRPLYARAAEICFGGRVSADILLADQQLAGLMMLVACPIFYVLAGVIIATRWLREMEGCGSATLSRSSARS